MYIFTLIYVIPNIIHTCLLLFRVYLGISFLLCYFVLYLFFLCFINLLV